MWSRISLALFATSTFLTPLQVSLAQEANAGGCSIMTIVTDAGEITWNTDEAAAELISIAKETNLTPEQAHEACHGEAVTQQAEADEAVEEEKVEDVASAEEVTEDTGEKTVMSSAGALLPLAGLGLAGGGGGGGGSSSSSTFLDESSSFTYNPSLAADWVTRQEYKNVAQYNSTSTIHPYTLIGVDYAYGMGLSGSGKTIAIHDTNFMTSAYHLEIIDKNNAGNFAVSGSLNSGGNWHGVHVAGIAAGDYNNNSATFVTDNGRASWGSTAYPLLDYGTMGVAYNAGLLMTDFSNTESGSVVQNRASMLTAASNASAIAQNNSWGMGACDTSTSCTYTVDRFIDYQTANGTSDTATLEAMDNLGVTTATNYQNYIDAALNYQNTGVIVFSAGNHSGKSEPNIYAGLPVLVTELADAWLAVGNLDFSGSTISSSGVTRYSNQCGSAAEFCLFADGTHITSSVGYSTSLSDSEYGVKSGSSMSAPMVSGAIALLSEAFPNHTPAQLTDRLLASANNSFFTTTGRTSFANGVEHGFNSEFGHGLVDLEAALKPITSSMYGNSILLGSDSMGNIASAQRFNLDNSKIQLGAAFGDSIQNTLNGRGAYFYDALNGGFAFDMGSLVKSQPITVSKRHSFDNLLGGNTIVKHQRENGFSFISDKSQGDSVEGSMMAFLPVSPTTTSFVGKNIHMQNAMSFTQRGVNSDYGVNSTNPFNIPFIQASEQGTSVGNKWGIDDGILSFGLFEGNEANYGLKTTGFVADYGREIGSTHTSVFFGGTNEEDGFLATSVEGAFAETSKANTTFAGISSYGWLNSDWSYNALGSVGSTALDVEGVGLLNDINDVTSTSFAFEMARSVGLNEQDSVHIGISQPLRVESGNATIMVPQLYDQNGNLNFSQASTDLSPSGRQLDLSFGYQAKLHDAFDVGVQFAVSQDYGHVQSEKLANSAFAFMKVAF